MVNSAGLWNDVVAIRERAPLVHNVTNLVVMDVTANALLAVGASPVMAHARQEVGDMAALAGALVLNMGTLDDGWVASILAALEAAREHGKPVVFDPVGAGATAYRTETARSMLTASGISVVRGNASEIAALAGAAGRTKGVDSLDDSVHIAEAAAGLLEHCQAVVISGEKDVVVSRDTRCVLGNGCALMTRITGMGCTATAIVGAFLAVQNDPFLAAAHAMAVMGIAGEIACERSSGPGSLRVNFLDALSGLEEQTLAARLRVEP
jgi:hydroxyethylthiazole kinase